MDKTGITAAGNWILDKTKIIDSYPPEDGLCNIISESAANGGGPYNILKDLARLGFPYPLTGIGKIGDDDEGRFILNDCLECGIDHKYLKPIRATKTSYTDVMTVKQTGRRTFFHYRGANALLDLSDFQPESLTCRIFYLGYLLLLDQLDTIDELRQVTKAAMLLERIQERGIKTAIDIVSENSNRFASVIPSCLPHIDFLFLNEFEASRITNLSVSNNGVDIHIQKLREAARKLIDMGVNEYVFLHFHDGVLFMDKNGNFRIQPRVNLPNDKVKGAAGAGDAFAAGVLYGLHENMSIDEALRCGVCTAASSLFSSSCSGGIKTLNEVLALGDEFGFIELK